VTRPWPGAFTWCDGKKLLVWKAETRPGRAAPGEVVLADDGAVCVGTGDGLLELLDVGSEGREGGTSGREWLAEAGVAPGTRLGA
jgi:methionyl-tRNA formyltransferase